MREAGQIALTPFPYTDLSGSKLRPVLLLQEAPGGRGDWLVCMVSSRLHQAVEHFDELVFPEDDDFVATGLKAPSVFRLSRLAVLHAGLMLGSIGCVGKGRLGRARERIAHWITWGESSL